MDGLSPGYPTSLLENPLDLKVEKTRRATVSATRGPGAAVYDSGFWRSRRFAPWGASSTEPFTGFRNPDLLYWETVALQKMNPSAPIVDLPLFLFELKDLPRMIQDLGSYLSGKLNKSSVPDSFLSYNFGWAPLLSDLKALLSLQDAIDNRIRFLQKRRHRRIKTHLGRNTGSREGTYLVKATPNGPLGPCKVSNTWYEEAWAVFDYVVDDLPNTSDVRPFLGLGSLSLKTSWDTLPWSWLIDYFANVSTFLSAYRGSIPYRLENANIMAHSLSKSRYEVTVTDLDWAQKVTQVTPGTRSWERKQRRSVAVARPHLRLDSFLTDGQKSILGALALSTLLR